jgi:hypothetical protein
VPASIGAITTPLERNFIYGNMIGVGKAGEFNGRKEGINTSYYSFPNMSLNRSCHACVHAFEMIRRRYQRKTYENLVEKLLKFLHNGLTWQEPSGPH